MKAIIKFSSLIAVWLLLSYPALSQTNMDTLNDDTLNNTSTTTYQERPHDDDDDGFDLGWIGLAGLLGLLGLRRNDRDRDVTIRR